MSGKSENDGTELNNFLIIPLLQLHGKLWLHQTARGLTVTVRGLSDPRVIERIEKFRAFYDILYNDIAQSIV